MGYADEIEAYKDFYLKHGYPMGETQIECRKAREFKTERESSVLCTVLAFLLGLAIGHIFW